MLGRFEVERELGKGAMGVVYLGTDPQTGKKVAIKTMALAQEFEDDQLDFVKQRFFREAEAVSRLQHPHIVTILESGEEHNLSYIAMEFLEGHDLSRYCYPENLMPVKEIIQIVTMAASALGYAHRNNVVHRDIKPANIMFNPENQSIKITDFGIARIVDSGITRSGKILGTPSYMSPEQLYGIKLDGRSDLFSLGVMLYEMVTGKLPFTGDSLADLMFNIANNPYQNIYEIKPALIEQAAGVSDVIDRALQKNMESRYQTAEDMVRDLENCAAMLDGGVFN